MDVIDHEGVVPVVANVQIPMLEAWERRRPAGSSSAGCQKGCRFSMRIDELPSILVSPLEGDADDIAGGMAWQDGVWTVEMGRKLVTGSPYDVQFDDLGDTYWVGVAVFDNAQVRHAYATEPVGLRFEQ